MKVTPSRLKWGLRLWSPLRGPGIWVESIADDWSSATVRLSFARTKRNIVGTAFGGSLSAMTDPFFMLLTLHQLGDEYVVWDTKAEIKFVKPGKGVVRSTMRVTQQQIDEIKQATAGGEKSLTWFECEIVDQEQQVVAKVRRQVYVRRKNARSIAGVLPEAPSFVEKTNKLEKI